MKAFGFCLRIRRTICLHSRSALTVTEQVLRNKRRRFRQIGVTSNRAYENWPTIVEVFGTIEFASKRMGGDLHLEAKNAIRRGFVP